MRRTAVLTALLGVVLLGAGLSTSTASATVLCKNNTNPCSGGTYAKGTTIEAAAGHFNIHNAFVNITCTSSALKGEVTDAGGEGGTVNGTVTSFAFSSCGSWAVSVLKKGTFSVQSPSEGNGTLVLEGFEITTEGFGLHCIFTGPISIPLTGGAMASLGPRRRWLAREEDRAPSAATPPNGQATTQ